MKSPSRHRMEFKVLAKLRLAIHPTSRCAPEHVLLDEEGKIQAKVDAIRAKGDYGKLSL